MTREQLRLLKEIMAVQFSLIDFNLYLNTHPRDKKALEDYNRCLRRLKDLKDYYQDTYGPLSAMVASEFPWQYIETEWPWQIEY